MHYHMPLLKLFTPLPQAHLHVTQPHVVHMMETVTSTPRPWYVGHLPAHGSEMGCRSVGAVLLEVQVWCRAASAPEA